MSQPPTPAQSATCLVTGVPPAPEGFLLPPVVAVLAAEAHRARVVIEAAGWRGLEARSRGPGQAELINVEDLPGWSGSGAHNGITTVPAVTPGIFRHQSMIT